MERQEKEAFDAAKRKMRENLAQQIAQKQAA
jgi:hypothetical protein